MLTVTPGVATMAFDHIVDPVGDSLLRGAEAQLRAVLDSEAFVSFRSYEIGSPRIRHHRPDGTTAVALTLKGSVVVGEAGDVDIIEYDANGNVVRDTAAERRAKRKAATALIEQAHAKSPLMGVLLTSFRQAAADPANEFTHLYEIRDALSTHFGGESQALAALGVTKATWQLLGKLANAEPLEQGRHRGKALGAQRPATASELTAARDAARNLIERFASTL